MVLGIKRLVALLSSSHRFTMTKASRSKARPAADSDSVSGPDAKTSQMKSKKTNKKNNTSKKTLGGKNKKRKCADTDEASEDQPPAKTAKPLTQLERDTEWREKYGDNTEEEIRGE